MKQLLQEATLSDDRLAGFARAAMARFEEDVQAERPGTPGRPELELNVAELLGLNSLLMEIDRLSIAERAARGVRDSLLGRLVRVIEALRYAGVYRTVRDPIQRVYDSLQAGSLRAPMRPRPPRREYWRKRHRRVIEDVDAFARND